MGLRTVETHLSAVYRKLGVRSRSELTRTWASGLPFTGRPQPTPTCPRRRPGPGRELCGFPGFVAPLRARMIDADKLGKLEARTGLVYVQVRKTSGRRRGRRRHAGRNTGLAAASPAAPAVPGIPAITIVSPIASGYAAVPKAGGAQDFIHVQATFTVPAVTCSAQNATAQTRAGLDGITDNTAETVGVNEVCLNAVPFYTAFYRMYPAALVPRSTRAPGDMVTASVTADAGIYTLSVHDLTSGKASPSPRPVPRA